jgi:DNA helicase HerA-like ATPase
MTLNDTFGKLAFDVPSIDLGFILHDGKPDAALPVRIPLSVMNRHGLIAGSTGTGKTRTLQLLAEGLSRAGVPVFLADVKGDLAGMSQPGVENERLTSRLAAAGRTFHGEAFPVEFFSLTGARGTQLRATVSSFGPVLLGKVLDLTDVQQSVLAMVFKYCDDRRMPLLDFKDLREVLLYLQGDGKADLAEYGAMSGQTVGVLVRKMVELEQQGAGRFFGDPELDIADLVRTNAGRGVVNILSLSDVQDKPRLWSTFLMWLLGQFYYKLPEVGDPDKPKLVFFFDEAHLLFESASKALEEHIELVARLIRSKGIGVFFITQTAKDIDDDVLAQLGNRVQHAVRAFTPKDAKDLKAAASTFPPSEYFDAGKMLTTLGIGEAFVSVLDPHGVPTPGAPVQILPPSSSMTAIDDGQFQRVAAASVVGPKYASAVDRESAYEMLRGRIASAAGDSPSQSSARRAESQPAPSRGRAHEETSVLKDVLGSRVVKNAANQAVRSIVREGLRGLFGMLKR